MKNFKIITQKFFDEIEQFQTHGEIRKLSRNISKIVKNI